MAAPLKSDQTTLAVVTGASKGIGKTIAIELSKCLADNSIIVLMARSNAGLNHTKGLLQENNKTLAIHTFALDLGKSTKEDYERAIRSALTSNNTTAINPSSSNSPSSSGIQSAVIFHNAGQIGTLDETLTLTNIEAWRDYYDLNLFSVALLNSVFLSEVKPFVQNPIVVNITSLCGSVPFQNMAMYGSGKAARNLFFKVLALESKDVSVLNYSPGPVDTDMVGEVLANVKDLSVRHIFTELKEKKTILTAEQTVKKLIGILQKGAFKSGDVIDYYDREA